MMKFFLSSCLVLLVVLAVCEAGKKGKSKKGHNHSSGSSGSSGSKSSSSKGRCGGSKKVCYTGIAEVPNCPDLGAPANSELKITVDARLTCDEGYFVNGTSQLTCKDGSDWDPWSIGFCQKLQDGQGAGSGSGSVSGSNSPIPNQAPYTVSMPVCRALFVPNHGIIAIIAQASLRCNNGVTGQSRLTCGPSTVNPDWSWDLGTCASSTDD